MRKHLHNIRLQAILYDIFLISDCWRRVQAVVGSAILGLVALGSKTKEAE